MRLPPLPRQRARWAQHVWPSWAWSPWPNAPERGCCEGHSDLSMPEMERPSLRVPVWGDDCLADVGTVFCWKLIVTHPHHAPRKQHVHWYTKCMSCFHMRIFFKQITKVIPNFLSTSIRTRWKLVIPGHWWWRTLRRNGKWIATKEILGGFGLLLLGHLVERCWCWLPAFG